MKKRTIRVAFIAMLGLAAVGCQKEPSVEPQNTATEQLTKITVLYSVNGAASQTTSCDDTGLDALMHRLVALAREGNVVVVSGSGSSSSPVQTKETVVYRTANEEDAVAWASNMVRLGFLVTITYDKSTNEFVCTAVR